MRNPLCFIKELKDCLLSEINEMSEDHDNADDAEKYRCEGAILACEGILDEIKKFEAGL